MSNREVRKEQPFVHVLMALARQSQGEKSACIRSVDKGRGDEVDILEAKLKFSDDRGVIRSKTFPGIAQAMAEQWG